MEISTRSHSLPVPISSNKKRKTRAVLAVEPENFLFNVPGSSINSTYGLASYNSGMGNEVMFNFPQLTFCTRLLCGVAEIRHLATGSVRASVRLGSCTLFAQCCTLRQLEPGERWPH